MPELIASLQNVLNPSESVALIGRKMTESFLEKQTTNFYSFFYSRRQPMNKLGEIYYPVCGKNRKVEKPYEEIRPSFLSQVYSEIYCRSFFTVCRNFAASRHRRRVLRSRFDSSAVWDRPLRTRLSISYEHLERNLKTNP